MASRDINDLQQYFIYALYDSREPSSYRYIGFTNNLKKRLTEHISESRYRLYHRHKWIQKVITSGHQVKIIALESGIETMQEAKEREIVSIRDYTLLGHKLTNGTIGGDGIVPTEGTKKKMRATMLLKYGFEHISQVPRYRENLSIIRKGRTYEDRFGVERANVIKDKIRKAFIGNTPSNKGKSIDELYSKERAESIRLKISKAAMGREPYNKGLPMPEEQKKKLIRFIVLQIDQTGTIVREWQGMQDIEKNSEYKRSKVSLAIKDGKMYRGYSWQRKNK